jgi:diguanylate cyclase (GGDEF)-like protein/PAS domain S-box-containing protein
MLIPGAPPPTPRLVGEGALDDRRLMTWSLVFVLLSGCALAAVWLVLPHTPRANDLGIAASGLSSLACVLPLLLVSPQRMRDRSLKAILALITANVSVGIAFAGEPGTTLELFYLWATPYAYFFFSLRHAVLQTLWVGVGFVAALAAQQAGGGVLPEGELLGRWLMVVGAVTVVGVLVRSLAGRVRHRDARFRRSFEDSPLGMALVTADLRYLEVNDAMCRVLARPRADVIGRPLSDVVHPDDYAAMGEAVRDGLAQDKTLHVAFEKRYLRPDGSLVPTRVNTSVLRSGTGYVFFSQVEDITERRRSEQELARRARQQQAVAELGLVALRNRHIGELMDECVATVRSTLEVDFCAVLERVADGSRLGRVADIGWPDAFAELTVAADATTHVGYALGSQEPVLIEDLATDERFSRSAMLQRLGVASGLAVVIEGRGQPFGVLAAHTERRRAFTTDDVNFMQAVANVMASAVERDDNDRVNRHAAMHDALTGLPNRSLAIDRIERALRRSRRASTTTAVLLLDVDRFKNVNDSLGHAAGDDLLRALAPRLEGVVRPGDTVARLGGDEFVVVCEGLDGFPDAAVISERLQRAIGEPITLESGEQVVTASIGIAVATHPGDTPESLVRDADAAMYRAKDRGPGGYERFDDQMRQDLLGRLQIESELRHGLKEGELRVHYQPVVDIQSGHIASVEALVRWQHPRRGSVPPLEFIPIAEESGLIADLGLWVLDAACRQVAAWQRDFDIPLGLSVNVSGRQIANSAFPAHVADVQRRSGLLPGTLALEITESVLLEEADSPAAVLAELSGQDLRLVLDDFGTGYSSLSYLKRFPLDALKVDRSFVAGLGGDAEDSGIVEAVVKMAQTLGLDVIAEGVETPAQLDELQRLGCQYGQGYLFARPLAAEVLEESLSGTLLPELSGPR